MIRGEIAHRTTQPYPTKTCPVCDSELGAKALWVQHGWSLVKVDTPECLAKLKVTPNAYVAKALGSLGVKPGDRIGTLAWNGHRHMELYYAVSGSGAVLHTLNPRLHPDQVVWIADHAEDQVLFFDLTFLPLIAAVAGRTKTVRHWVAMTWSMPWGRR